MSKLPKPSVSRTSRVYLVPIKMMRTPTAGICQREFRPAWGAYLAKNLRLEELGIPVMNKRDGHYWVVDGQHRIYALRENGFNGPDDKIECEVYESLTDEEMAAVFDGRNTRKAVNTLDHFLVRCTRGNPRETAIRRAVESNGMKIGRDKDSGQIACVGALGRVYDVGGEVVAGQVVRTLAKSFAADAYAFDPQLIVGLGNVFNRFNGRTEERWLTQKLSEYQHGARGILQRAQHQRDKTGNEKWQCVAATIVDIYNKGVAQAKRLPSWWKSAAEGQ